jgi:uncharacterized protein
MIEFEWDRAKAAANLRKHGVSFELATRAFQDRFGFEQLDERETYDEDRTILLGMVDGIVLLVVFTSRADTIRLISARKANRHEQDHYYRENGP